MSGGNNKRIPIDLLDRMPNGRYLPYILWRLDLLLLKASAGSDHSSSPQDDIVVADSALAAVTVTDEARYRLLLNENTFGAPPGLHANGWNFPPI
jgi:hypothetical protein